jgi:hypothetical protein
LNDNGENAFQRTDSAILIAINKLVPDSPTPYPLLNISSKRIVMIVAIVNCKTIKIAFPAPIELIYPYIPDHV